MACNKNEWHPVHWINYWISTIAKIPSTEQDGGINVMSMGRNGSSLAWIPSTEQDGGINVMSMGRNGSSLAWMTTGRNGSSLAWMTTTTLLSYF